MSKTTCSFNKYDSCVSIYNGDDVKTFASKVKSMNYVNYFLHNGDFKWGDKMFSELTNQELEDVLNIHKGDYFYRKSLVLSYGKKIWNTEVRSPFTVNEFLTNIIIDHNFDKHNVIKLLKEFFYLKTILLHFLYNKDGVGKYNNYEYVLIDVINQFDDDKLLLILTKNKDTYEETLKNDSLIGLYLSIDNDKLSLQKELFDVNVNSTIYSCVNTSFILDDFIVFDDVDLKPDTNCYYRMRYFKIVRYKYLNAIKISYNDKETELLYDCSVGDEYLIHEKHYLVLYKYKPNGKYTKYLIDEDLNSVTNEYDNIEQIDNFIILKSISPNKKVIVLDFSKNKEKVFECDDLEITNSKDKAFRFTLNNKIGFVDKSFNIIIPNIYINSERNFSLYDAQTKMFCVSLDGKNYGCINAQGNVIIPFDYHHIYFDYNYVVANKHGDNSAVALFDSKGNVIISSDENFGEGSFGFLKDKEFCLIKNKYLVKKYSNEKTEVINLKSDKKFTLCNLDLVGKTLFKDEFTPVQNIDTNLYGLINKDGVLIMPCISKKLVTSI